MAFTGFYALIGFKLSSYFNSQRYIYSSIAIGSIIPSIDIIFSPIFSLLGISGSTSSWSHSVFTIAIVALSLLALSEYKKNNIYKHVSKGLAIGMTLHLILDCILSSESIYILWPLPVNRVNSLFSLAGDLSFASYILDFFFIRMLAAFMLNSLMETNVGHRWISVALTYLMSLQVYLCIFFTFLLVLGASDSMMSAIFSLTSTLQLIFIVSCISLLSINFERLYNKEKQS